MWEVKKMSDTYIVMAHYNEKRSGSVVLGHFQTYEEALECLEELQEYRNIFGKSVFSGGSAYSVPEKPRNKDDFKYRGLGE